MNFQNHDYQTKEYLKYQNIYCIFTAVPMFLTKQNLEMHDIRDIKYNGDETTKILVESYNAEIAFCHIQMWVHVIFNDRITFLKLCLIFDLCNYIIHKSGHLLPKSINEIKVSAMPQVVNETTRKI